MPAFSIMVADFLFLQAALPFGADFSPQNWETCRRIIEELAEKLFDDPSLRAKHRQYLDRITFAPDLRNGVPNAVPAKACSQRRGVLDEHGNPLPTPHRLFVDDDIYADRFDVARVEQAIAASIEAIFILLGVSELDKRQDPISFDKLEEMLVHYLNKVLGLVLDTRRLDIGVPPAFVAETLRILRPYHVSRKVFRVKEMEAITGKLIFIAGTAPWLKLIMPHLFMSIAAAVGENINTLKRTNKSFRELLKRHRDPDANERSFAQAASARRAHNFHQTHFINATMREELHLIVRVLESKRQARSLRSARFWVASAA